MKWSQIKLKIHQKVHFWDIFIFWPVSIKFPIVLVTLKIYHHRKEKSYRGSKDSFGNGMTRGTTWEGVEYLVVTKVKISIALASSFLSYHTIMKLLETKTYSFVSIQKLFIKKISKKIGASMVCISIGAKLSNILFPFVTTPIYETCDITNSGFIFVVFITQYN